MASVTKTRNTATRLLTAVAVLSGLVLSAAQAQAAAPPPSTAASAVTATTLPAVDMEATVLAAQIDPRRADSTLTPGAHDSVLAVERALQARGLLDATWVDGYFGTSTISAYAAYQRSLGYSGLAANGLPGTTSLTTLGQGRYTVTHQIGPGAKLQRDGYTVNTRTQNMLTEAERLLGFRLTLSQGSYNPGGDPTSAGTHDGGGVVDINVDGMTSSTRTAVALALRQVGFAAWIRNPTQGDWPWHIHAAAINDTDLATQAQNQTGDYYLGLNGLANHAADDGPRIPIQTWEQYQRSH
ncbi:peptidoglycan-binding domain-containing protein [Kitasatospora phosalacinea]|uniref:Peptidoglycan-binding protein n=1 Tax=Kitasatospora phosalacinea TaxID=2065 RepID=A0A9W6UM58_9ACTN|nr:peptidoglycan-binding domain-containing protein [Kitasatospora phosalacinea]GLW55106.1 peptidoglycan-binding protein [Kitasatospora phosalacinea]